MSPLPSSESSEVADVELPSSPFEEVVTSSEASAVADAEPSSLDEAEAVASSESSEVEGDVFPVSLLSPPLSEVAVTSSEDALGLSSFEGVVSSFGEAVLSSDDVVELSSSSEGFATSSDGEVEPSSPEEV